jgi:hypothetical protein
MPFDDTNLPEGPREFDAQPLNSKTPRTREEWDAYIAQVKAKRPANVHDGNGSNDAPKNGKQPATPKAPARATPRPEDSVGDPEIVRTCRERLRGTDPKKHLEIWRQTAREGAAIVLIEPNRKLAIVDGLTHVLRSHDNFGLSIDELQRELDAIFRAAEANSGKRSEKANPPQAYPTKDSKPSSKTKLTLPPLTVEQWKARELAPPDRLLGSLLTTTSRALLIAATALGKTNFGMQMGYNTSLGRDFLHWKGYRPCRTLYVDGEIPQRLLRDRTIDCERRVGETSKTFFALSHEDVIEQGFGPLNTPQGQAFFDRFINELGGVDLIFFDSIMCLMTGEMKEEEPWGKALPWIRSLTTRKIGQIWIHHTGHDESKGYGTKTREWQMDLVGQMTRLDHPETDVCFTIDFTKARERTPDTRADFRTVKAMLLRDQWICDGASIAKPMPISDTAQRFLDALHNVHAGEVGEHVKIIDGRRAASIAAWKRECAKLGLIDPLTKGNKLSDSARSGFSVYRRQLVAARRIGCDDKWSWVI